MARKKENYTDPQWEKIQLHRRARGKATRAAAKLASVTVKHQAGEATDAQLKEATRLAESARKAAEKAKKEARRATGADPKPKTPAKSATKTPSKPKTARKPRAKAGPKSEAPKVEQEAAKVEAATRAEASEPTTTA